MEPIVNNFEPPKPADLGTLSNNEPGTKAEAPQLPEGLDAQQILKYSKTRNSTFDKWFGPKVSMLEKFHRFARNNMVGMVKGIKSMPLPIGASIIDAVNARLQNVILNRPKHVEAISQTPQTDNGLQETVEDFVNQKLSAVIRQPEVGKSAIKSALIESFTIVRSVWCREAYTIMQPTYEAHAVTGEQIQTGEQPVTSFKEYWKAEPKNPVNCAWEPHTTTKVQDSPWFRERSKMSYNELLKWQNEGRIWNVEYLKTVVPSGMSGSQKEDWEERLKKADGDSAWRFQYADEKEYQIDEWFADLTVKGQIIKSHYFIVENEHLIYWEENTLDPKRIPYVSCPIIIDPRSVMGVGLLEIIEDVLEQINTYSSKQDTIVERYSSPLIFYDESSGLTGRTTFMKLNGLVPVTNAAGIKQFDMNPGAVTVVQEYLNFLIGLARESSGANEQFQGIEGADTATEFNGLQAAAGSRFADVADTLNQGLVEALALECFLFYRQLGVDGQMVMHDTTQDGAAVPITRQQLQGDYVFNSISTATENYKKQQIGDDNEFVQQMVGANQSGGFGPGQPTPQGMPTVKKYNVPKHIEEVSMPLRGQKTSQDMFIDEPLPPMPMMPPGPGQPMRPQAAPPQMQEMA